MSSTSVLGAPAKNAYLMGRFTLHRFVRCEATAGDATAISWQNMSNVVSIDIDEPTWDFEADVYHAGGGNEKRHIRSGPRWNGTITVLGGKIGDTLRLLQEVTWDDSTQAVLSPRMDKDDPEIIIESICRDHDNGTHLFTRVIQDAILDDMGDALGLDYADKVIPFHTYHEWFLLATSAEMVYHVWSATPSTATYTISNSTPLSLLTATSHDDWAFDNMVFCKVKDNSAGDSIGKRVTAGVSLSGDELVFTTGTPAATDQVYCLFAK